MKVVTTLLATLVVLGDGASSFAQTRGNSRFEKTAVLMIVTRDVTPTTPTTNSVRNPKLEQRVLSLLPPGLTIREASRGFKNWGEFVAAAHLSKNLHIPFAHLKSKVTGIPASSSVSRTPPMSLGEALQSLKTGPTGGGEWSSFRIRREVKKAEDTANSDLRNTRDGS